MKNGIQEGDVKVGDVIRFTHEGIENCWVIAEVLSVADYPSIPMAVISVDNPFNDSVEKFFHGYTGVESFNSIPVVTFLNTDDSDFRWRFLKEEQLDLFNETD